MLFRCDNGDGGGRDGISDNNKMIVVVVTVLRGNVYCGLWYTVTFNTYVHPIDLRPRFIKVSLGPGVCESYWDEADAKVWTKDEASATFSPPSL